MIPGELPAHDASFCIWKQFRNDFVDSATVTSLPTVTKQLCTCWEALMGTKLYSGFQNILFTTPWIMSQKASRFHFEHCVSLQDGNPPNQVFYQNICNCLYWYQMKSDNNWIGLHYQAHLRWRFQVFWICTKNVFVLLLFCTIRNKVQYDN